MSDPGQPLIGLRTALLLYGALVLLSFASLRGSARILSLLIIGALVVKSIVHYYRERIE